jgi:hypothetical protein
VITVMAAVMPLKAVIAATMTKLRIRVVLVEGAPPAERRCALAAYSVIADAHAFAASTGWAHRRASAAAMAAVLVGDQALPARS